MDNPVEIRNQDVNKPRGVVHQWINEDGSISHLLSNGLIWRESPAVKESWIPRASLDEEEEDG